MKKAIVFLVCTLLIFALASWEDLETGLASTKTDKYESGYQEGYGAGYKEGYEAGRKDGFSAGKIAGYEEGEKAGYAALKPLYKPTSGTILSGREYDGSEITVTADSTDDYVVSLKDANGTAYVTFFVRAGETVTIGVPEQYLYIYFASGTEWYGYGKGLMFGEDTVYSKDDEAKDFWTYTWEYTLYPVTNGNFSETPSDESEFF